MSFQKNLKYLNIVSKILKNLSFRLAVVDRPSKVSYKKRARRERTEKVFQEKVQRRGNNLNAAWFKHMTWLLLLLRR